jgi:hypothetical protein
MRLSRVKADQIKAVEPDTVSTACENCNTQLTAIAGHYVIKATVRFQSDIVAESHEEWSFNPGRGKAQSPRSRRASVTTPALSRPTCRLYGRSMHPLYAADKMD